MPGGLYEERERRFDKFQNFIDRHYKKTSVSYDSDLLETMDPGFDCYICCTDVIWRKDTHYGFDRGFFLGSSCMKGKWKIAYAAGRGDARAEVLARTQTPDDERIFFEYLSDMDVISVREESTAEYIREKSGRDVPTVLDPVLLHEASFYEKLLIRPKEEHYLFLYYVMKEDETTARQALRFARAHDLTIVETSERAMTQGILSGEEGIRYIYRSDCGIEEWLGYIRYADYIFTNSFHCCCLSILFEKQFFAGPRKSDKVPLLLARVGLKERRFSRKSDLVRKPRPDIDYTDVRSRLQELRAESASFILSAIRMAQATPHAEKDSIVYRRRLKYRINYRSGESAELMPSADAAAVAPHLKKYRSGTVELHMPDEVMNDESSCFAPNIFIRDGWRFAGWQVQVRANQYWMWILEDGSFVRKEMYDPSSMAPIRIFADQACIPYLPLSNIDLMAAEAIWEEGPAASFVLVCNSGTKSPELMWNYHGYVELTQAGLTQWRMQNPVANDGKYRLAENGFRYPEHVFVGWHLRIKCHDRWYWVLRDLSVKPKEDYDKRSDGPLLLLGDGDVLPFLENPGLMVAAAVAVWKKTPGR